MIKTIKVKKQFNLHELIKHVWDNTLSGVYYKSDCQTFELRFDAFGRLGEVKGLLRNIEKQNTFTVEVEEEITELTRFDRAIALSLSAQGGIQLFSHDYENLTLGKILNSNNHRKLHQVYAMINGKLELIWEDK